MSTNIDKWLNGIWSERHAGKIASVQAAYVAKCGELGIPATRGSGPARDFRALLARGLSPASAIELLLIDVSLARRDLELERAQQHCEALARLAKDEGVGPHFQLSFQQGLNHLCLGDRAKALEAFVSARAEARTDEERAYAVCNILLCAEDLGLDFSHLLDELEATLAGLTPDAQCRDVLHQVDALRVREAFRAADFSQVEAFANALSPGDQTDYLLAMIGSLPTVAISPALIEPIRARLALRIKEGFMVAYELRTLTGIAHADDFAPTLRLTEQIERAYLWLWRWLVSGSAPDLAKLVRLKNHLVAGLGGMLSADEFQCFDLVLRWLSLFLGLTVEQSRQAMTSVTVATSREFPVWHYESLLLDWLFALRDGRLDVADRLRSELDQHPLAGEPRYRLPELYRCVRDGTAPSVPFVVLARSLAPILKRPSDPRGQRIRVTAGSAEIEHPTPSGVKTYRSRPLAQLMMLASRGKSWHASVILQTCFDLPVYDESRHENKLAKLLTQANHMFRPHARFSRKGDYVFATIEPGRLELTDDTPHAWSLMSERAAYDYMVRPGRLLDSAGKTSDSPRRATVADEAPFSATNEMKSSERAPSTLASLHSVSGWLTRSDVESLLGASRSATIKKLNEWLDEGLVTRQGVGRASRYRLSAALVGQLFFSGEMATRATGSPTGRDANH